MRLNGNFSRLKNSYLFTEVGRRTAAYSSAHPERRIIRLSVGDVTLPLVPAVIHAMRQAVDELSRAETFRGYAPEHGYDFLLDAVRSDYVRKGISLFRDEIFVSDGAKSDCGNLSALFSADSTVLLPDPVYPAYLDVNLMAGRKVLYSRGTEENGFLPAPERGVHADIIYLCSPNNPTGAAYSKEQLGEWVDYAIGQGAVILFDAAYESFVRDEGVARSIYEVEGARTCAIEICSFSKTAGFTGVRCGYTVIPRELEREGVSLNRMWARRQSATYNGTSYVSQRGAEAALSEEGRRQISLSAERYRANAAAIMRCLGGLGVPYTGGRNSPYIWMKCPHGLDSWTFFGELLEQANVVGTPGVGFGEGGEGYFRLSSFGTEADTLEACERLSAYYNGKVR